MEDIQTLKPTFLASVPRVLNRVMDKIQAGVKAKGAFSEYMFNKALTSKKYNLENNGVFKHAVYDKLIFGKLKAIFGGRVQKMLTASAPMNPETLLNLKVILGIHIHEVYGQTELAGPVTGTHYLDRTKGHVGGAIPSCVVRLKDVPEMNYYSTDEPPRGEICFKADHAFSGYFKMPERTAEAFDEDGFILSGDVGAIHPNGAVSILDRVKNIFKLAQGEYIAPEKIENIFSQCSLVAQIFCYGDSFQSYLVAIVVPDMEAVGLWAAANNVAVEGVLENEDLRKTVHAEMMEKASAFSLTSMEKPKHIWLSPNAFSMENDCITPTFKIKRIGAKKLF